MSLRPEKEWSLPLAYLPTSSISERPSYMILLRRRQILVFAIQLLYANIGDNSRCILGRKYHDHAAMMRSRPRQCGLKFMIAKWPSHIGLFATGEV